MFDLVLSLQGRNRLGLRFEDLDNLESFKQLHKLHDYWILKKSCKYYKNPNYEVRNWEKYGRYIDKKIYIVFLIAFRLLTIVPYI